MNRGRMPHYSEVSAEVVSQSKNGTCALFPYWTRLLVVNL